MRKKFTENFYCKWEKWKTVGDFGIFNEHIEEKYNTPSILLVILRSLKLKMQTRVLSYIRQNVICFIEYYMSLVHCQEALLPNEFGFMSNSLRFFTFWSQTHIHSDPHKDTKRHITEYISRNTVLKFFNLAGAKKRNGKGESKEENYTM